MLSHLGKYHPFLSTGFPDVARAGRNLPNLAASLVVWSNFYRQKSAVALCSLAILFILAPASSIGFRLRT
jgi:hypothetical protein